MVKLVRRDLLRGSGSLDWNRVFHINILTGSYSGVFLSVESPATFTLVAEPGGSSCRGRLKEIGSGDRTEFSLSLANWIFNQQF